MFSRTKLFGSAYSAPPYRQHFDDKSRHPHLLNNLPHSFPSLVSRIVPASSPRIRLTLRATTRPPQPIYDAFISSKQRILSFVLDPHALPSNRGIKAAAWKFAQKVLLCGTRAPAADPRVSVVLLCSTFSRGPFTRCRTPSESDNEIRLCARSRNIELS